MQAASKDVRLFGLLVVTNQDSSAPLPAVISSLLRLICTNDAEKMWRRSTRTNDSGLVTPGWHRGDSDWVTADLVTQGWQWLGVTAGMVTPGWQWLGDCWPGDTGVTLTVIGWLLAWWHRGDSDWVTAGLVTPGWQWLGGDCWPGDTGVTVIGGWLLAWWHRGDNDWVTAGLVTLGWQWLGDGWPGDTGVTVMGGDCWPGDTGVTVIGGWLLTWWHRGDSDWGVTAGLVTPGWQWLGGDCWHGAADRHTYQTATISWWALHNKSQQNNTIFKKIMSTIKFL